MIDNNIGKWQNIYNYDREKCVVSTLQISRPTQKPKGAGTLYEYECLDTNQKVDPHGYGPSILVHGNTGWGSKIFVTGGDPAIIVEGDVAWDTVIIARTSNASILIHGNVASGAYIEVGLESQIEVRGYISDKVRIRAGTDSVVSVRPDPDQLTPEEYGVYEADLLNQQLLGIDYTPHMNMPFHQWWYMRHPVGSPGR